MKKGIVFVVVACVGIVVMSVSPGYAQKNSCSVPVNVSRQGGTSTWDEQWESMRSIFDILSGPQFMGRGVYRGMDIVETSDAYVFEFDLPGIEKKDITIEIADDVLTVSAERYSAWDQDDSGKYTYIVRSSERHGVISRSFTLPEDVDAASVQAAYENGVLTLTIPRIEVKDDVIRIDVT